MKRLFKVVLEWRLAGDEENVNTSSYTVVADKAEDAVSTALHEEKDGWIEKLDFCRLQSVVVLNEIDFVATA